VSGKVKLDFGPAIELARQPDFTLGAMTVRPSAREVVVDAVTRRVEPRVMQTLVALVQANESVVSRDELMARCWSGVVVSEDAVTRAVGQVRRLAALAPTAFTIETIPKIGYRLVRVAASEPRADAARSTMPAPKVQTSSRAASIALGTIAGLVIVAGAFALRLSDPSPPPSVAAMGQRNELGTQNAEARDRQLRASALLSAGGRDNALRAEQLLREARQLDPSFHAAKESLVVALLSAAAFVPERAGEAHAEIADILDSEIVETPLVWRAHVMRGFQHVFQGDWAATERALEKARSAAPEDALGPIGALETFLFGNLGRIADSFEFVTEQARVQPLSRDQSRVLQQWLDRTGRHEEAEAEYTRSRDLPGDRSAMELAALVRALGSRDPERVTEQLVRYRETDWGRAGDDALFAVHNEPSAAIPLLRNQIETYGQDGAMPPFLAAAWASYYGDIALSVEGLRAHSESLFAQAGLIWDPVFANTRRTAAFKAFLRDFGYVDYWRTHAWGDFCRPSGEDDFECR
jgi:DNA-binding winged helix-turn-helix (wHTH) protein